MGTAYIILILCLKYIDGFTFFSVKEILQEHFPIKLGNLEHLSRKIAPLSKYVQSKYSIYMKNH